MLALALPPQDAISQLDALVSSARLPTREADRCARLADTLRRPARVCLLGLAQGDIAHIVHAILGSLDLPKDAMPPAMELQYGPALRSNATLEDGTTLAQDGWPSADILRREPVFLQIDLPAALLQSMSFLVLALEPSPAVYQPALSWAARRSEIAIWCTRSFNVADARIWGRAPERLTQHSYLLETRPDGSQTRHGTVANFTETFATPGFGQTSAVPDITALIERLTADIEDARNADLDMAQLFLHRLGHLAPASGDADDSLDAGEGHRRTRPQAPDLRPLLSEPLLYLMGRAGDLAGHLAGKDAAQDWANVALAHCSDTAEALRDRAENWPDDVAIVQSLQTTIEEICDTTTLLQIEAGAEQAKDAAAMLFQLRAAFEHALGWGNE